MAYPRVRQTRGPSFVNESGNLGVNQTYNDVDHPDFWAANRISDPIGGDVNTVVTDNQIYKSNVQNNPPMYTTPASQMLTFFPDTQGDFNYFPLHQSSEDPRANYSNVEPTPLEWGLDLDLNLFNHPPPSN
ncbi:hypothetical protein Hanom_Chr01g00026961 [Helianthus anomalus]